MPVQMVREFLRLESAGGITLMAAAALGLMAANTPLVSAYYAFLDLPFELRLGSLYLAKPLLLWINDGWMAVFFLLIGLEIKREILEGELSRPDQVVLPATAAVGGVLGPALIYLWFNLAEAGEPGGWAVPTATDIAFALGVLSLFGKRVPIELKLFLATVAIVDDLAAILIIAIFYTSDLSLLSLSLAGGGLAVLLALNLSGVTRTGAYLLVGAVIWVLVLKSGVHATLAGVAVAATIPLRARDEEGHSPARHLEHRLHPWVAFLILPTFAFANAGVRLVGLDFATVNTAVVWGIAVGLVVGKQVGVFGLAWLVVRLGFARLPANCRWDHMYGAALLCGVGFTMSLFIGTLAYEHGHLTGHTATRLGVLSGSLLSALMGSVVLGLALRRGRDAPA